MPEGDIVYLRRLLLRLLWIGLMSLPRFFLASNASGSDKVERSIPAVAQPAPAAAPAAPAAFAQPTFIW